MSCQVSLHPHVSPVCLLLHPLGVEAPVCLCFWDLLRLPRLRSGPDVLVPSVPGTELHENKTDGSPGSQNLLTCSGCQIAAC